MTAEDLKSRLKQVATGWTLTLTTEEFLLLKTQFTPQAWQDIRRVGFASGQSVIGTYGNIMLVEQVSGDLERVEREQALEQLAMMLDAPARRTT